MEADQGTKDLQTVVQEMQALRQQMLAMEMRTLVAEQSVAKLEEAGGDGMSGTVWAPGGFSAGTWLTSGRVVLNGVAHDLTLDLTKRYVVVNVRTEEIRQEAGPRPTATDPDEEWFDLFEPEIHVTRFG